MFREPSLVPTTASAETGRGGPLCYVTRTCVRYAERYIPDPFLYGVVLTERHERLLRRLREERVMLLFPYPSLY